MNERINDIFRDEKQYDYEYVLTNEEQQRRIMDYVRPVMSDLDVLNLVLAYGVREKNSGLLVVQLKISTFVEGWRRDVYYTTKFLVLADSTYEVSYTCQNIHALGEIIYDIPEHNLELVKGALDFWRNSSSQKAFEEEYKKASPGYNLFKLNKKLCATLRNELKGHQAPITPAPVNVAEVHQNSNDKVSNIEESTLPPPANENDTNAIDYKYEFALTNEKQQKRIADYVQPVTDQWDILNLMMAYGVREKNTGLFIVRLKSSNKRDENTGVNYYTTYFCVIAETIYEVSYTSQELNDTGELTYDISNGNVAIIKGALDFWRDWPAHKVYEKEYEKLNPDSSILELNNELRSPLFDELYEYQEQEKKAKELQERKHMEIHSEEDAKKLFLIYGANYRKIKDDYDEETSEAFEKYSSDHLMRVWILEKCVNILKSILEGDTDKLYARISLVDSHCHYWLGARADVLVPLYTQVWRTLFEKDICFGDCINSFLNNMLLRSNNPACVSEFLDMVEEYYRDEKVGDKYRKSDFRQICGDLRRKMKELSEPDETRNFQFSDDDFYGI